MDLIHIVSVQPLFIDYLLDFLENMQPFEEGLRPSIRMALLELIQNLPSIRGPQPEHGFRGNSIVSATGSRFVCSTLDEGFRER